MEIELKSCDGGWIVFLKKQYYDPLSISDGKTKKEAIENAVDCLNILNKQLNNEWMKEFKRKAEEN